MPDKGQAPTLEELGLKSDLEEVLREFDEAMEKVRPPMLDPIPHLKQACVGDIDSPYKIDKLDALSILRLFFESMRLHRDTGQIHMTSVDLVKGMKYEKRRINEEDCGPKQTIRVLEGELAAADKALRKQLKEGYNKGLDRDAVIESASQCFVKVAELWGAIEELRERHNIHETSSWILNRSDLYHTSKEAIRWVYHQEFSWAARYFGGSLPPQIPQKTRNVNCPLGVYFYAAVAYINGVRTKLLSEEEEPFNDMQEEIAFLRATIAVRELHRIKEKRRRLVELWRRLLRQAPEQLRSRPGAYAEATNALASLWDEQGRAYRVDEAGDQRILWNLARGYKPRSNRSARKRNTMTHRLLAGRCALAHALYTRSPLTDKDAVDIVVALAEATSEKMESPDDDEVMACMLELLAKIRGLAGIIGKRVKSHEVVKRVAEKADEIQKRKFHTDPAINQQHRDAAFQRACQNARVWLCNPTLQEAAEKQHCLTGITIKKARDNHKKYIPDEQYLPLV